LQSVWLIASNRRVHAARCSRRFSTRLSHAQEFSSGYFYAR